ncbi:MAG TPA: recombinase family protein [Chloroflexota bacterium]|nr:recombinase family protein [Chloroflexota bacterium]
MSHDTVIHSTHLARTAIVYVRQSTPKQLVQHQESTRRQYQLARKAEELGWPQPRITVIDEDLGLSGAHSEERKGFQRLVAAISLGEVGIVLVTEVSRLSRRDSDWHRVIELCAVFETVIADEDGLYDPRDPNDRLLLGLKGTLFSAELHILRARMRGGLLNKAQRGALALRLPVGFRRLPDGTVVHDPDDQVRATLHTLFEQFALLQNARAVQRYFLAHDLLMPRYVQSGPEAGQLYWTKPTYQMIQQVLTNPAYAGLFVYGRRVQQVQPGTPLKTRAHRRSPDEWDIVVPQVYPPYIDETRYATNRELLRANMYNFSKTHPGAAREGPGVLTGLIVCGRCGRRMTPSYGGDHQVYHCRLAKLTYAAPACQSFSMRYLDAAIRDQFFAAIQPARLETILTALQVVEQERQALDRQWQLKIERARYATKLAQRQYDAVDPDNRLVARELEKRWNEALATLDGLEREYARAQRTDLAPLTDDEQSALRQLAADLPTVWDAPTTTFADRKRLLRLVIQEVRVTLTHPTSPRAAEVVIRWSGGMTTSETVTCPPLGWHAQTDAALVEKIRLLAQQLPDHRIAEELNAANLKTKAGKEWTYRRVGSLRRHYQIPTACPLDPGLGASRADGLISVASAAARLGVSQALIHLWSQRGIVAIEQRMAQSYCWVRLSEEDVARLDGSRDWRHLATVREVMRERNWSRDEVWNAVKAGHYRAYRQRIGQCWEWRLEATTPVSTQAVPSDVVDAGNPAMSVPAAEADLVVLRSIEGNVKGTSHYA